MNNRTRNLLQILSLFFILSALTVSIPSEVFAATPPTIEVGTKTGSAFTPKYYFEPGDTAVIKLTIYGNEFNGMPKSTGLKFRTTGTYIETATVSRVTNFAHNNRGHSLTVSSGPPFSVEGGLGSPDEDDGRYVYISVTLGDGGYSLPRTFNVNASPESASRIEYFAPGPNEAEFFPYGTITLTDDGNPPPADTPSCPYTSNASTSVFSFPANTALRPTQTAYYTTNVFPFSLSSGTYDVRIYTYDHHSDPTENQPLEQARLNILRTNNGADVIQDIGRTADIPNNSTSRSTLFSNVNISENGSHLQAYHPEAPSSVYNSLYIVCASFERITVGPTNTPTQIPTVTPVPSATNTPVPTATNTPIPTATPIPSPTPIPVADPWLQVFGGGLYSKGSVQTNIPATAVDPYLIDNDSSYTPDIAASASFSLSGGSISTTQWRKDDNITYNYPTLSVDEVFKTFEGLIDDNSYTGYKPSTTDLADDGMVVYFADPVGNSLSLNASGVGSWTDIDFPLIILSTKTINIPTSISTGVRKLSMGPNGFIMIVSKGDINIDYRIDLNNNNNRSTMNLEGLFIAAKSFNSSTGGVGGRINIAGNVIFGMDETCANPLVNCSYQSSRTHSENYLYPADYIVYNPKIIINAPQILTTPHVKWGEVD